jgi:cation diffusion facilitator CzcD-associated flavoprotein CzcO
VNTVSNLSQRFQHSTTTSHGAPSPDYDVSIVGAGPYGLAAAAHLEAKGLTVRVFGQPMDFWANTMPAGMLLRSPREASNISDPRSAFTLNAYEKAFGLEPVAPLPLSTFVQYGRWFRQQLKSDLITTPVAGVTRENSRFRITLQDGQSHSSRRVVVAAGIGPFQRIPAAFQRLPLERCSHCYQAPAIGAPARTRVAVIGAGQSALESGALLHEAGAEVEIIARIPNLRWIGMHSWLHHLGPVSKALYSKHDVGPAGISRLVAAPHIVFHFPLKLRDKIRTRAVRPAGAKWLPPRLTSVKITTGRIVQSAKAVGNEVQLTLDDGSERRVDHILLGTGYNVDISRYDFLPRELAAEVRTLDGYPVLRRGFCSSVPGLHFIGATAARNFGPLLYFVAGTEFAATELTTHISQNRVNAL